MTDLTGASAGTYGNSTAVPQIVIDANGRITGITNVSVAGGGGLSRTVDHLSEQQEQLILDLT